MKPSGTKLGGSSLSASTLGGSTVVGNQSTTGPSNHAAIDLTHLRPTTKFDQLTKDLQNEIENLDNAIHNEIQKASEIPLALEKIATTGQAIPGAIELVTGKLEEVETGLENDADAIVGMRDGAAKKGEGEAKCVFRSIDRLKVPRQYQVGHKQNESISGGVYGASGLSGWWNNPQILKASTRSGGGQAQTMQLPGFIRGDSIASGRNLVDLVPTQSQSDSAYVFPRSIARSPFVRDFVFSPIYAQPHDIVSASTNFARHLIHAAIDLSKHVLK